MDKLTYIESRRAKTNELPGLDGPRDAGPAIRPMVDQQPCPVSGSTSRQS